MSVTRNIYSVSDSVELLANALRGKERLNTDCRGKVLMISWAFPPAGGSGVQRSAKFAKYLGCWGWEPIVWTADRIVDLPEDKSLLTDLPGGLDIRRGKNPDPCNCVCDILGFGKQDGSGAQRGKIARALEWRFQRIMSRLRAGLIPDPAVFWVLTSFFECRRIIEREGIDVIYSTYSPPSNHLLGWLLKKVSGLPWVADFRDLWTKDYCYPDYGRVHKWLDRKFEGKFLEDADAVIGVTQGQSEIFRDSITSNKEKVVTISNGVDAEDFERMNRREVRARLHGAEDCFVLSFVGWFLQNRIGEGLLEGLGRFSKWVKKREGHFEFRVVGKISNDMLDLFNKHDIEVRATGYLPHDKAIEYLVATDVLLLTASPGVIGDTCAGGKSYEYLASGRPILVAAPSENGVAYKLVKECDAGVAVVCSEKAIFEALKNLWLKWADGELPNGCSAEKLKPLTRKHLTGELADVLNRVK